MRPALAWLWPVVIDGTIVVALLTVLAANRAARKAGYPWALAGLFSAASVAFNVAHAPDRPVAQLVFAMAPVALVLTTHLLMQQVGWGRATAGPTAPGAEQQAGAEAAHPHRSDDDRTLQPVTPNQGAQVGARARVRAAYEAQVLAEFTADPASPGHPNGDHPAAAGRTNQVPADHAEGR